MSGKGISAAELQGRLLVVDGTEASPEKSGLATSRIQSAYVLDAKRATEKFGEKGRNGAVVVTTK